MPHYYVIYIILAILPMANIKVFCDPDKIRYRFEDLCLALSLRKNGASVAES